MGVSDELDGLTQTFAKDREFCDCLFASEQAHNAAELLVYCRWASMFLPHFQASLVTMTPLHFRQENEIAKFWTATLIGGLIKDTCLVPYFVLRGLVSETGSILAVASNTVES